MCMWEGRRQARLVGASGRRPSVSHRHPYFCLLPTSRPTPTKPSSPRMGADPMLCFSTRVMGCSGTQPSVWATRSSWASPGKTWRKGCQYWADTPFPAHTPSPAQGMAGSSLLMHLISTDFTSSSASFIAASNEKCPNSCCHLSYPGPWAWHYFFFFFTLNSLISIDIFDFSWLLKYQNNSQHLLC